MNAKPNRSHLFTFRRKRGQDTTEWTAGNSLAWLIIAILLIVLAVFGLTKFGPELWQLLKFAQPSLT